MIYYSRNDDFQNYFLLFIWMLLLQTQSFIYLRSMRSYFYIKLGLNSVRTWYVY